MLNTFQKECREKVSVKYPLSVSPRELDKVSEQMFGRYVAEELPARFESNSRNAERLRTDLEPMGFNFQSDHDGRANYVLGATVPADCDRDRLLNYLLAHRLPVKPLWPCPWPWISDPHGASGRFPATARLAKNAIGFRVDRMDYKSRDDTVAAILRYLDER
jgi:hypothetical protein